MMIFLALYNFNYFCKFEDALVLIESHEFFLKKGNMYIPENELYKLFMLALKQKMEKNNE